MEIETITVQLGDRQFEVKEATFGYGRRWRRRFADELKPLFSQLAEVSGIEFETPADLLQLWPLAEAALVNGIDTVFELLVTYSPALEEDRIWIEENATEKQVLYAFKEIVTHSGPFELVKMLGDLSGRPASKTSTSSPALSGE